jgi:CheY-like chemotaxis protein
MPLRILLVDDSMIDLRVALRMLRKLGCRADPAANGIEAIEALERQPYDIVLMDVQMPQMDGLEATRIIRSRWSQYPRIIIATTLDECREMSIDAGADDFLTKPIFLNDLREAIKKCSPKVLPDTLPCSTE